MTPITHTYSPHATRSRPWERWTEPEQGKPATYQTIPVKVIVSLPTWSLIRRNDGQSIVVLTEDLTQ